MRGADHLPSGITTTLGSALRGCLGILLHDPKFTDAVVTDQQQRLCLGLVTTSPSCPRQRPRSHSS